MVAAVEEEREKEDLDEKKSENQTLDSILGKWSKGEKRDEGLTRLAALLENLQSRVGFKISPRGWCYQLENENIINKGDFDRAEEAINDCRKRGFLDIDFCAEDVSRAWDVLEQPTKDGVENHFRRYLRVALNVNEYYTPDWWEGEKYYIQMVVEKVDLKTLFTPVCKAFHVPIANTAGWWDLNMRAEMALRFKRAERERGQQCVLLCCGDFDPWGRKITDTYRGNLREITEATRYDPADLIIDRFGLEYEFISDNNLTWIDNLATSSGKDMSKSSYCYNCNIQYDEGTRKRRTCGKGLYIQPQFVRDYVATYGVRKCEANALVVIPDQAKQLAQDAIIKYLGLESFSRMKAKRDKIKRQFARYKANNPVLIDELNYQVTLDDVDGGQEASDRESRR